MQRQTAAKRQVGVAASKLRIAPPLAELLPLKLLLAIVRVMNEESLIHNGVLRTVVYRRMSRALVLYECPDGLIRNLQGGVGMLCLIQILHSPTSDSAIASSASTTAFPKRERYNSSRSSISR